MAQNRPAGWAARAIPAIVFLGAVATVPAAPEDAGAVTVTVAVHSSRPDMVSGGDALVEIRVPPAASPRTLQVTLNGRDVSKAFRENSTRHSLTGIMDGLRDGRNSLVAKAGSSSATIALTNYPITGPIVSGPAAFGRRWVQMASNSEAGRIPVHFTAGFGARQRRCATGASAKGTPL
jgi:hypothetical protein